MHGHLNVSSNFLPCRKQVLEEFYVIRFRALIIKTKKNAKKLYTLMQFFFLQLWQKNFDMLQQFVWVMLRECESIFEFNIDYKEVK